MYLSWKCLGLGLDGTVFLTSLIGPSVVVVVVVVGVIYSMDGRDCLVA